MDENGLDRRAVDELHQLELTGQFGFIRTMIDAYDSQFIDSFDELKLAAKNGDVTTLLHLSHRFKSSSLTLGAAHLAQLYAAVAKIADHGSTDGALEILDEISTIHPHTRRILEAECKAQEVSQQPTD